MVDWKEEVSSHSWMHDSMVCLGLEALIHNSVKYIFSAIEVHHCFDIHCSYTFVDSGLGSAFVKCFGLLIGSTFLFPAALRSQVC